VSFGPSVGEPGYLPYCGGCKVEACRACGYSIDGGKTSKFRTSPFCGDWFIDEIDEEGTEVVCQGCGAQAPAEIWNRRDSLDAPQPGAGQ
jgi:hypothetical protein